MKKFITDTAIAIRNTVNNMSTMTFKNQIVHGDCIDIMKKLDNDSIDMILTSPPYDNLRDYKGYSFPFETIAKELYRIVQNGGVVVWVVGDATIDGSETGTSFTQALFFKNIGFNIHDTMIFKKRNPIPQIYRRRYNNEFEYMFVFSKGQVSTHNPIYVVGKNLEDQEAKEHPAPFPCELARDHITSWTNEGDVVLDPMCGSGTTCKAAKQLGRNYIGIDICCEYCEIARERLISYNSYDLFINEFLPSKISLDENKNGTSISTTNGYNR